MTIVAERSAIIIVVVLPLSVILCARIAQVKNLQPEMTRQKGEKFMNAILLTVNELEPCLLVQAQVNQSGRLDHNVKHHGSVQWNTKARRCRMLRVRFFISFWCCPSRQAPVRPLGSMLALTRVVTVTKDSSQYPFLLW